MSFEIRDLMVRLAAEDGGNCEGQSGCQGQSGCPAQSAADENCTGTEQPSDRAGQGRFTAGPGTLSLLRSQLRATLSQPGAA